MELLVSLKEEATYITDNRLPEYTYHSLEDILLIVIFGIMANCNTFMEIYLFMQKRIEWLKKYITFDFGIPSISTIKRVIGMINPKELEEILNNSLKKYLYKEINYYKDDEIVIKDLKTMDGKTANSSDRKSSKQGEIKKMNAMSIFSVTQNVCEATGIELLKRVNIEDCIIVFEAMSTQKDTISYIKEKGGYYVAPVKGNQSTLKENISLYFENETNCKKINNQNYIKKTEKAHGNAEKREYLFSEDKDWLYNKQEWAGLRSIGYAKRTYTDKHGKEITDTRYYITNLPANKINVLSNAIRGEWQIENGLHLYLDMVFNEDKNKCFLENSQKNFNSNKVKYEFNQI